MVYIRALHYLALLILSGCNTNLDDFCAVSHIRTTHKNSQKYLEKLSPPFVINHMKIYMIWMSQNERLLKTRGKLQNLQLSMNMVPLHLPHWVDTLPKTRAWKQWITITSLNIELPNSSCKVLGDTVDGSESGVHQLRLVVYPIIYTVLAPSQVVSRISSINSMSFRVLQKKLHKFGFDKHA